MFSEPVGIFVIFFRIFVDFFGIFWPIKFFDGKFPQFVFNFRPFLGSVGILDQFLEFF